MDELTLRPSTAFCITLFADAMLSCISVRILLSELVIASDIYLISLAYARRRSWISLSVLPQ